MEAIKDLNIKNLVSRTAHPRTLIKSGFGLWDEFLEGGLREGEVSEWGMPWGQDLREIILPFLTAVQRDHGHWVLWIYGHSKIGINPLAWQARAIDLQRIRFVQSQRPLKDLRPVFLSDLFRMIVIDHAADLNEDDYAFLARQARSQRQSILLLQPQLLSHKQGNVWSKLRINCSYDFQQQEIIATLLKGRRPRQIRWQLPGLKA